MFKEFIKKINNGYVYSSLKNIAECMGVFIVSTKHDNSAQKLVVDELGHCAHELFLLNFNELHDKEGDGRWKDDWQSNYAELGHSAYELFLNNVNKFHNEEAHGQ